VGENVYFGVLLKGINGERCIRLGGRGGPRETEERRKGSLYKGRSRKKAAVRIGELVGGGRV